MEQTHPGRGKQPYNEQNYNCFPPPSENPIEPVKSSDNDQKKDENRTEYLASLPAEEFEGKLEFSSK